MLDLGPQCHVASQAVILARDIHVGEPKGRVVGLGEDQVAGDALAHGGIQRLVPKVDPVRRYDDTSPHAGNCIAPAGAQFSRTRHVERGERHVFARETFKLDRTDPAFAPQGVIVEFDLGGPDPRLRPCNGEHHGRSVRIGQRAGDLRILRPALRRDQSIATQFQRLGLEEQIRHPDRLVLKPGRVEVQHALPPEERLILLFEQRSQVTGQIGFDLQLSLLSVAFTIDNGGCAHLPGQPVLTIGREHDVRGEIVEPILAFDPHRQSRLARQAGEVRDDAALPFFEPKIHGKHLGGVGIRPGKGQVAQFAVSAGQRHVDRPLAVGQIGRTFQRHFDAFAQHRRAEDEAFGVDQADVDRNGQVRQREIGRFRRRAG